MRLLGQCLFCGLWTADINWDIVILLSRLWLKLIFFSKTLNLIQCSPAPRINRTVCVVEIFILHWGKMSLSRLPDNCMIYTDQVNEILHKKSGRKVGALFLDVFSSSLIVNVILDEFTSFPSEVKSSMDRQGYARILPFSGVGKVEHGSVWTNPTTEQLRWGSAERFCLIQNHRGICKNNVQLHKEQFQFSGPFLLNPFDSSVELFKCTKSELTREVV